MRNGATVKSNFIVASLAGRGVLIPPLTVIEQVGIKLQGEVCKNGMTGPN